MAGKSRRKRGKQSPSRKARDQQRPTAATRTSVGPPTSEAVTRLEVTPPPAVMSAPQSTRPQTIQFPYIATELRTVGILAGIMLVVLIILYFTLV
jgi:hypothetical protein